MPPPLLLLVAHGHLPNQLRTLLPLPQAVEIVERDLLWDGPPIRLSNKGHLRLASYLFKVSATTVVTLSLCNTYTIA